MKKLIAYRTDVKLTADIIKTFSDSINKHIKGWSSVCLHINEFIKNGIPTSTDAVATLGILRGTGQPLKEAAKQNIKNYYIDHAYLEAEYGGDCCLRLSKNKTIKINQYK